MARTAAATRRDIEATTPDLDEFRTRVRSKQKRAHAYVALLGLRTFEPLRIYATARRGLPYTALRRLQRNLGLPSGAVAELAQIPARTLARRRQQGKLDPDESDRLIRVARIFGRALELFEGDVPIARQWLSTEQVALGGLRPLDLTQTDVGAQEVDRLVGRLEYGLPV